MFKILYIKSVNLLDVNYYKLGNIYLILSGISLPAFLSRTKLKLHKIFVTRKMVKKVIMNLDLPFAHVWNTVATSGLVPLVATWNC